MPRAREPQSGLFDREIESPELEGALETLERLADAAAEIRAAQKVLGGIKASLEIKDGERIRCGAFILTGAARNGGGFEVPAWSGVTIASYERVE